MVNWDEFAYTRPISAALTVAFGVQFPASNTGGGCICLQSSDMEGGVYVLVGSASNGPLMRASELEQLKAEGIRSQGYGVGVYGCEDGWTRAMAVDYLATTPELVVELAKRAVTMAAADRGESTYPRWTRDIDGNITNDRGMK